MNLRKKHALLNPGRAGLKSTLSLQSCVTTAELHQRASLSPVSRRSNADGNADLAGCPKDQRRSGRPLAGPRGGSLSQAWLPQEQVARALRPCRWVWTARSEGAAPVQHGHTGFSGGAGAQRPHWRGRGSVVSGFQR